MTTLKQRILEQLKAIPTLNEYVNRLPSKTKDWIIEATTQAFIEWLQQNPPTVGEWGSTYQKRLLEELEE